MLLLPIAKIVIHIMDVLEFKYKKSRVNFNLIFIAAGLLFFGSFLYFGRENQLFGYAWLAVSFLYAYSYYRMKTFPYVRISGKNIEIYEAFAKRTIAKSEIIKVVKSIGDYKILTSNKSFRIQGSLLESADKDILEKELKQFY